MNDHPVGASTPTAAIHTFLTALEHRDGRGMRTVMTPSTQQDEIIHGGLLNNPPKLTSFRIGSHERESPYGNASPAGSIASLRYVVALTPAGGFDDDDTDGDSYDILVSESAQQRWFVAELGGGG
ncbi:MAG TPA: hypothetical protein VHZ06_05795 [Marmoricola sp.]|nr:hypothetical protein [Marmoricola sp.]